MQLNIKNVAPFATKEQIDALDSASSAGSTSPRRSTKLLLLISKTLLALFAKNVNM